MQIRSLGQKNPLEEEMAAHSNILFFFFFHSNILAWEIPWTEELGGLQSIESQRVGPIFFFFGPIFASEQQDNFINS